MNIQEQAKEVLKAAQDIHIATEHEASLGKIYGLIADLENEFNILREEVNAQRLKAEATFKQLAEAKNTLHKALRNAKLTHYKSITYFNGGWYATQIPLMPDQLTLDNSQKIGNNLEQGLQWIANMKEKYGN